MKKIITTTLFLVFSIVSFSQISSFYIKKHFSVSYTPTIGIPQGGNLVPIINHDFKFEFNHDRSQSLGLRYKFASDEISASTSFYTDKLGFSKTYKQIFNSHTFGVFIKFYGGSGDWNNRFQFTLGADYQLLNLEDGVAITESTYDPYYGNNYETIIGYKDINIEDFMISTSIGTDFLIAKTVIIGYNAHFGLPFGSFVGFLNTDVVTRSIHGSNLVNEILRVGLTFGLSRNFDKTEY